MKTLEKYNDAISMHPGFPSGEEVDLSFIKNQLSQLKDAKIRSFPNGKDGVIVDKWVIFVNDPYYTWEPISDIDVQVGGLTTQSKEKIESLKHHLTDILERRLEENSSMSNKEGNYVSDGQQATERSFDTRGEFPGNGTVEESA